MYTLPIILFCSGILLGGIHGYFTGHTVLDTIFSIGVGGFLGSALGAVVFMYVYLRHQEFDDDDLCPEEKMLESSHRISLPPLQNQAQGQKPPSPKCRPEITPISNTTIGEDDTTTDKAGRIQALEKEINTLKNKRKGN